MKRLSIYAVTALVLLALAGVLGGDGGAITVTLALNRILALLIFWAIGVYAAPGRAPLKAPPPYPTSSIINLDIGY